MAWLGLAAPADTPRDWRERLNTEAQKALADPEFAAKLATLGALPRGGGIEDFAGFLKSEQTRWKGVVERSGVKVE